jgi:uncharacterized CHY-type Zn-finger protein
MEQNDQVMQEVKGKTVDQHTRCVHYHLAMDIIAIKFKCCGEYYPCFSCHQEVAGHQPELWPEAEFDTPAILCGMCGHQLTIQEYFDSNNQCTACQAAFNPGCKNHYHLYFQVNSCGNANQ